MTGKVSGRTARRKHTGTGIEELASDSIRGWIDTRAASGISMPPMAAAPTPPARPDGVPGFIKILGALSFTLSVGLVLLVHHWLTAWKCPIPQ
jgi:hypothetical protein